MNSTAAARVIRPPRSAASCASLAGSASVAFRLSSRFRSWSTVSGASAIPARFYSASRAAHSVRAAARYPSLRTAAGALAAPDPAEPVRKRKQALGV